MEEVTDQKTKKVCRRHTFLFSDLYSLISEQSCLRILTAFSS